MLVLSRRPKEKICFPGLDISVEVLRVNGDHVRVGIEAPRDIEILRHELLERTGAEVVANKRAASTLSHELRNRLNTATLALHLTQQQLQLGRVEDAEQTLEKALRQFLSLSHELANSTSRSRPATSQPKHVLVVEDDTNERELLSGVLQMNGFAVDTAENGMEAMDYLDRNELPDGVLMDMRMPRLNGPDTVSAIRKTPSYTELKVFAVSATDPNELGVSTGPQGINRWFSKPLNPTSLVDELKREFTPQLN